MTNIDGLAGAVTLLIDGIKASVDYHAEQKRHRRLQEQQRHDFFEQFAGASGPPDDNHGALTIREYCRRLSEIIKTHRHYLWRNASNSSRSLKGGYDARAAHGFIAAGLMTAALMPGMPQASEEPSIADNSVPAAIAHNVSDAYQRAETLLRNVYEMIQNTPDADFRPVAMTLEDVENKLKISFAVGANEHALETARQQVSASQPQLGLAILPCPHATEENIRNISAAQMSPDALHQACQNAERRHVQALSRKASLSSTAYSGAIPQSLGSPGPSSYPVPGTSASINSTQTMWAPNYSESPPEQSTIYNPLSQAYQYPQSQQPQQPQQPPQQSFSHPYQYSQPQPQQWSQPAAYPPSTSQTPYSPNHHYPTQPNVPGLGGYPPPTSPYTTQAPAPYPQYGIGRSVPGTIPPYGVQMDAGGSAGSVGWADQTHPAPYPP